MRCLLFRIHLDELVDLLSGTEINEVVLRAIPVHVRHFLWIVGLWVDLQM